MPGTDPSRVALRGHHAPGALTGLDGGRYTVHARRLGYSPAERTADLQKNAKCRVGGNKDTRHPATGKLAVECVCGAERVLKLIAEVGHLRGEATLRGRQRMTPPIRATHDSSAMAGPIGWLSRRLNSFVPCERGTEA